jgi:hypothetical protein
LIWLSSLTILSTIESFKALVGSLDTEGLVCMDVKEREVEIATKRVALTPSTWATLSNLREPGQTFDQTIAELISEHQRFRLIADLDFIDSTESIIPWDRAKQELGLKE